MRMPSLNELFSLMITRGSQAASEVVAEMPEQSPLVPTSLRLHPRTRAYYEQQAEACGAPSASAMMSMVLEGVMKATRTPEEITSTEAVRDGVELVKERFLHLFRVHSFTPYMIAEVLRPHGIGLAELADDAKLLSLLSEEVIKEQAERFWVSLDWLRGKSTNPIDQTHMLHKNPDWLCRRIVDLMCGDENRELTVLFVREKGANFQQAFESDTNQGGDIGVVVRQTCQTPSGKPYHRYQAWKTVPWAYRETRLAVKVVILWLERLENVSFPRVGVGGVEVETRLLSSICNYGTLPAEVLEERPYPAPRLKRWDPEDYVADPKKVHYALEGSERPVALKYYGYNKMDELFAPLRYVRKEALAIGIDGARVDTVK